MPKSGYLRSKASSMRAMSAGSSRISAVAVEHDRLQVGPGEAGLDD
jgi:hypothetical protein